MMQRIHRQAHASVALLAIALLLTFVNALHAARPAQERKGWDLLPEILGGIKGRN